MKITTDTWAQNPETGEQGLESVSYEPGAHADDVLPLAVLDAMREVEPAASARGLCDVGPRDASTLIAGARWTQAALTEYSASRGKPRPRCESELTLLTYLAGPRDAQIRPEQWRARASPEGVEARLLVQRVDHEGTPLIVSAEAHHLNTTNRKAGRR